MSQRNQKIVLGVLLVLLVVVYFWNKSSVDSIAGVSAADIQFTPLNVQQPELRVDLLDKIHRSKYGMARIAIFSRSAPRQSNRLGSLETWLRKGRSILMVRACRHLHSRRKSPRNFLAQPRCPHLAGTSHFFKAVKMSLSSLKATHFSPVTASSTSPTNPPTSWKSPAAATPSSLSSHRSSIKPPIESTNQPQPPINPIRTHPNDR